MNEAFTQYKIDEEVLWVTRGHTIEELEHVWKEKLDKSSGRIFYSNKGTGAKKWHLVKDKKDKKSKKDKKNKKSKSRENSSEDDEVEEPDFTAFLGREGRTKRELSLSEDPVGGDYEGKTDDSRVIDSALDVTSSAHLVQKISSEELQSNYPPTLSRKLSDSVTARQSLPNTLLDTGIESLRTLQAEDSSQRSQQHEFRSVYTTLPVDEGIHTERDTFEMNRKETVSHSKSEGNPTEQENTVHTQEYRVTTARPSSFLASPTVRTSTTESLYTATQAPPPTSSAPSTALPESSSTRCSPGGWTPSTCTESEDSPNLQRFCDKLEEDHGSSRGTHKMDRNESGNWNDSCSELGRVNVSSSAIKRTDEELFPGSATSNLMKRVDSKPQSFVSTKNNNTDIVTNTTETHEFGRGGMPAVSLGWETETPKNLPSLHTHTENSKVSTKIDGIKFVVDPPCDESFTDNDMIDDRQHPENHETDHPCRVTSPSPTRTEHCEYHVPSETSNRESNAIRLYSRLHEKSIKASSEFRAGTCLQQPLNHGYSTTNGITLDQATEHDFLQSRSEGIPRLSVSQAGNSFARRLSELRYEMRSVLTQPPSERTVLHSPHSDPSRPKRSQDITRLTETLTSDFEQKARASSERFCAVGLETESSHLDYPLHPSEMSTSFELLQHASSQGDPLARIGEITYARANALLKIEIDQLRKRLVKVSSERDSFAAQVEALQSQLAHVRGELSCARHEHEETQVKHQFARAEIAHLTQALQNALAIAYRTAMTSGTATTQHRLGGSPVRYGTPKHREGGAMESSSTTTFLPQVIPSAIGAPATAAESSQTSFRVIQGIRNRLSEIVPSISDRSVGSSLRPRGMAPGAQPSNVSPPRVHNMTTENTHAYKEDNARMARMLADLRRELERYRIAQSETSVTDVSFTSPGTAPRSTTVPNIPGMYHPHSGSEPHGGATPRVERRDMAHNGWYMTTDMNSAEGLDSTGGLPNVSPIQLVPHTDHGTVTYSAYGNGVHAPHSPLASVPNSLSYGGNIHSSRVHHPTMSTAHLSSSNQLAPLQHEQSYGSRGYRTENHRDPGTVGQPQVTIARELYKKITAQGGVPNTSTHIPYPQTDNLTASSYATGQYYNRRY